MRSEVHEAWPGFQILCHVEVARYVPQVLVPEGIKQSHTAVRLRGTGFFKSGKLAPEVIATRPVGIFDDDRFGGFRGKRQQRGTGYSARRGFQQTENVWNRGIHGYLVRNFLEIPATGTLGRRSPVFRENPLTLGNGFLTHTATRIFRQKIMGQASPPDGRILYCPAHEVR